MTGTFASPDALSAPPGSPFLSPYGFADGNPEANTDPSGMGAVHQSCSTFACWARGAAVGCAVNVICGQLVVIGVGVFDPIEIPAGEELILEARAAEEALPEALTLGRNAETGVSVYRGARDGEDVYVGITNNFARRAAEHGDRFQLSEMGSRLTRGEARAVEQAMIERSPGFENAINSISPSHPYYGQAVRWGESWLTRNGF